MTKYKLKSIVKAPPKSPKKYVATFVNKDTGRIKKTSFGAKGYTDYTKHKDASRKARYLKRHSKREHWGDPTSAGSLSRYILWNKTSFRESVADYKRHFNLG